MSIESKIFKGTSWLALFKSASQVISWGVTIIVARILVPGDFGLMDMATIITGYAFFFSELGFGAAIIQRADITKNELSSIFWFGLIVNVVLALGSFVIAYPTAMIFHEPKVIPITRATSALFLLAGLNIVPMNILKRDLSFKDVGIIEMTGTTVSCAAMLVIAVSGGGVWTLIGGHIVRAFTNVVQTFIRAKWLPMRHFKFKEVRPFLRFGVSVAIGQSLFYVHSKSDRMFGGRALASSALGFYSLALQLAQLPTEKIVVLINQVSFPAFAKMARDKERFNKLYLNITKITAILVMPLFVGGFLVGESLIRLILNEKWFAMLPLFKYLCLVQVMTAMNAVNDFVHTAQGRPEWPMYFNATMALFLPISFYFAAQRGLNGMLLPWCTTYLFICAGWIIVTLNKLGIAVTAYLKNLHVPVISVFLMAFVLVTTGYLLKISVPALTSFPLFISKVCIGSLTYMLCVWCFDKNLLKNAVRMIKA